MNSSEKGGTFLGRRGLVAPAALAVALFAQVTGASAALTGPDGQVLGPNTVQHAAPGSHKAGPAAPSGPIARNTRTITVTTTADGVPGSLRASIAEARPGDTVAVPPGTYVLTQGELKIKKPLIVAGAGAAQTTIDGDEESRVFLIEMPPGPKTQMTISGLTITGGNARVPLAQFGTPSGAAVASVSADLTLRDDVITRNVTKLSGENGVVFGGAVLANQGSFTMVGTTVSENLTSVTGDGEFGGFIIGGAISAEGTASTVVEDSRIVDNRAQGSDGDAVIVGGGMRIVGFGPVLVSGSEFSGNVAQIDSGEVVAGGLHVIGEPARIVGDRFLGNTADPGSGIGQAGGLNVSGIGSIEGSLIEANRVLGAESLGGNLVAEPGFLLEEHDLRVSHTSVLHGFGPAGSENCATRLEATITSLGFNRESTDQCGFHAEGDEVNVG